MRWTNLWLIVVCACSEPRLLLEIDTPHGSMSPTTLELVLAYSTVDVRDGQRTNMIVPAMTAGPETETVYYLAQRTRLDFEFDGQTPIDGFSVQVVAQEVESYIPIVVARDAVGSIIGIGGVTDEFTETTLRRVDYLYDVTHYTIEVEPVAEPTNLATGGVAPIQDGELRVVECDGMGTSGYAWRPIARTFVRPQLRILLPFDRPDGDASPRFSNGADLDCDTHTPKERGATGDQLDCDDTSPIVFGGPPEGEICTLDKVDNDCDVNTAGATVTPQACAGRGGCTSQALGITCTEDVGPFDGAICPVDLDIDCPNCRIFSQGPPAGDAIGCESHLQWSIPDACRMASTCQIRLVYADPRWDVRIGDVGGMRKGLYTFHQPTTPALDIVLVPRAGVVFGANDPGGTFVVMIRTGPAAIGRMFEFTLDMLDRVPLCPEPSTTPVFCL